MKEQIESHWADFIKPVEKIVTQSALMGRRLFCKHLELPLAKAAGLTLRLHQRQDIPCAKRRV